MNKHYNIDIERETNINKITLSGPNKFKLTLTSSLCENSIEDLITIITHYFEEKLYEDNIYDKYYDNISSWTELINN